MQLLCDTLEKRLDEVSRRGFRLERRLLDSFCATIKGACCISVNEKCTDTTMMSLK